MSAVVFFSLKLPSSKFKNLIYLKAFRALAEPGEAVGLLAAQVMGCRFFPFTCLINFECLDSCSSLFERQKNDAQTKLETYGSLN